MFEESDAKRVRRSEAFEDANSESEAELEAATNIKEIKDAIGLDYHFDYDLVETDLGKTQFAHLQIHEPVQDEGDEAFEFRLFSIPIPSTSKDVPTNQRPVPTKINIRSPTPDQPSDGRFVNPYRPLSYYFAKSLTREDFSDAAVSGDDLLQRSHGAWPGTKLPWRVIHLPSLKVRTSDLPSNTKTSLKVSDKETRTKRKPSKKRRILLRTRAKAVDLKVKEKEEHLREKKTRLNRGKKLKRKAKEKAKKLDEKGKEGEGDKD